jgi:archaellin
MLTTTTDQQTVWHLAVFLALLVVAAISFGLLVTTVGMLQEDEQDTTPELSVTNATVAVNDPDADSVAVSDDIRDGGEPVGYELRLTVDIGADTGVDDLTDLRLEVENGGGRGTLRHVSSVVEAGDLDPDGTVDDTPVGRDMYFVQPVAEGAGGNNGRYEIIVPTGVFVDHDGELRNTPTDDARVAEPTRGYDDPDTTVDPIQVLDTGEGIDNSGLQLLESGEELTVTIHSRDGHVLSTVTVNLPTLTAHDGQSVSVSVS